MEMTIEKFGEIVDRFITDAHIQMMIDLPEGTEEPKIYNTAHLGSVIEFYILMRAIKSGFKDMLKEMSQIPDFNSDGDTDVLIDQLLELIKADMKEAANDQH